MNVKFRVARVILTALCLLFGFVAFCSAVFLFLFVNGRFDMIVRLFQSLSLSSFENAKLFGAAIWMLVSGLFLTIAGVMVLLKKPAGSWLAALFGLLSTVCYAIGAALRWMPFWWILAIGAAMCFAKTVLALCVAIMDVPNPIRVHKSHYPDIGTNPQELIVFFSRSGNARKAAYELANKTGADVFELLPVAHVSGVGGYWRCVRTAVFHSVTPVQPIFIDLRRYDRITICSPVWLSALSGPVRYFCLFAARKPKAVSYVLVQRSKRPCWKVVEEMDTLLDMRHDAVTFYCYQSEKLNLIHSKEV